MTIPADDFRVTSTGTKQLANVGLRGNEIGVLRGRRRDYTPAVEPSRGQLRVPRIKQISRWNCNRRTHRARAGIRGRRMNDPLRVPVAFLRALILKVIAVLRNQKFTWIQQPSSRLWFDARYEG